MAQDERSMPEARPAASLTSGLLARRGDARPAMRRQAIHHLHLPVAAHEDLGWNDIGEELERPVMPAPMPLGLTPPDQFPAHDLEPEETGEEDFVPVAVSEPEAPALPVAEAPMAVSPLTRRLAAIAERINTPQPRDVSFRPMVARKVAPRRSPARTENVQIGRKAAFTLRLDPERHLRLRLLSALRNNSAQQLLIEALDVLLEQNDKVEDLATQVESENNRLAEQNGLKRQA